MVLWVGFVCVGWCFVDWCLRVWVGWCFRLVFLVEFGLMLGYGWVLVFLVFSLSCGLA